MRNTIITNVNGRDVAIVDARPDQMALAWLRSEGLISVKEGCGEGDCGACTVALGTPTETGLDWREVASCLLFLPMLDGRAILTAEGLKTDDGSQHPVQKAMADEFGTQCGFCSPGIAMSLFAMNRRGAADDEEIFDGLAGNLCRCTGYRPILKVARELPTSPPDPAEALLAGRLREQTAEPLSYGAGDCRFFAPSTLADALDYRAAHPDAWVLAGGTDLGLFVTKRHQHPAEILSLTRIPELSGIEERPGALVIGAAVPYARVLRVVDARHPQLTKLLRRIGASQVRNQGTLGGNLGTASPIGDSLPALIALGASVEVASSRGRRSVAAEDFVTGYRANALAPDELIVSVSLPDLPEGWHLRTYKVAKRRDQDISTLSAAFCLKLENGRVAGLRAAFGGVADRPVRARALESALVGQEWTAAGLSKARPSLGQDISPMSDFRGSADYRRKVAANLLTRLWHETTDEPAGLPVSLDLI